MTEPLSAAIRTTSREASALRDWIEERRRKHFNALASIACEPRDADVYRGRIAELNTLERDLFPEVSNEKA